MVGGGRWGCTCCVAEGGGRQEAAESNVSAVPRQKRVRACRGRGRARDSPPRVRVRVLAPVPISLRPAMNRRATWPLSHNPSTHINSA